MFVAGFVGRGASHAEGGSEWLHTVLEGSAQGMHSVLLGMRDPLIGEPSDGSQTLHRVSPSNIYLMPVMYVGCVLRSLAGGRPLIFC